MSYHTLESAYRMLERQQRQFREAIAGVPDDDLNTWKPEAATTGGGEMNTFAVLAVHIVGAGESRLVKHIYDEEYPRDRDAEFRATATAAEIDAMFNTWLTGFRDRLDAPSQPDLDGLPLVPREDHPEWTRGDWLASMLDHTALHIGHAQIHRQLWIAERGKPTG